MVNVPSTALHQDGSSSASSSVIKRVAMYGVIGVCRPSQALILSLKVLTYGGIVASLLELKGWICCRFQGFSCKQKTCAWPENKPS